MDKIEELKKEQEVITNIANKNNWISGEHISNYLTSMQMVQFDTIHDLIIIEQERAKAEIRIDLERVRILAIVDTYLTDEELKVCKREIYEKDD